MATRYPDGVLALLTSCAGTTLSLDRAVASFRPLAIRAVALHRAPSRAEAAALRPFARHVRFEAVFVEEPGIDVGARIVVVEGGPAGPDREQSLEELCRRLHAQPHRNIALRTPANGDDHPRPEEIELVREALPFVGYWHDAGRDGEAHLDAGACWVKGASFDPLAVDVAGIRQALTGGAPAVVDCAREQLEEALRHARGFFDG